MPTTEEIEHPRLGHVTVSLKPQLHRISACWRKGRIAVNAPAGISAADLNRALDRLAPRLLAVKPQLAYRDGLTLRFPGIDIVIRTQHFAPLKILATASLPTSSIEVGTGIEFNNEETTVAISNLLCKIAAKTAPELLLPRARELVAAIGRQPAAWQISAGHHTLGRCSSRGIISLSYILVFLPDDLRDYIICHELAHLSEMNHGPRFHNLLDRYLNGREKALARRLRTFNWPILRR